MNIRLMAVAALICGTTTVAAASDDDGVLEVPGEYATIQSAIDNAVDGNEVVVADGAYHEAISFNGLAITVRSEHGPEHTTIDATGLNSSVVRFTNGEQANSVLEGFTITGGTGTATMGSTYGGGVYARLTHPTIRNCIVHDNSAGGGGGLSLYMAWATVETCTIRDNAADAGGSAGGAGVHIFASNASFTNCSFLGNSANAAAVGGGANLTNSSPSFTNCLFYANSGWAGGAIFNNSGDPLFTNCTFVHNTSYTDASGGAIYSGGSNATPVVANSILWNNQAGDTANMIREDLGSQTTISYSIVQEAWTGAGHNNSQENPSFTDPANGNFGLSAGSPAIDAGDRTSIPSNIGLDVIGSPRFHDDTGMPDTGNGPNPMVDIGAYEFQGQTESTCPADTTGDGLVNVFDLLDLLANWGGGGAGADIASPNDVVNVFDLLDMLSSWGLCD